MPTITTWQGEDSGWTITIGYDTPTGKWYWSSVAGTAIDALVAAGAARDGRGSPLPQTFKADPRVIRVA